MRDHRGPQSFETCPVNLGLAGVRTNKSCLDSFNLLVGDADGSIQRDADAGEQGGEQVCLITFDAGEETAGLQRAAPFAGEDEGEIVATVLVAVLEARAPHHDAVVEQGAVAFLEGVHLLHHVGVLLDVELVDRRHLPNLFLIAAVVRLRMVLVAEAQLGIGRAVGSGADIGADAGGVGLEREHGQVAHHLHVFAALVALGNLHLDGRGVGGVAFGGADAVFLQRRFLLAGLDGGDAAFQ